MKQEVFEEYIKKIDFSKLTRNYLENPLRKISGKWESPDKSDIEYLYIELNFPRNIITKIFSADIFTIKGMNIPEKSKEKKLFSQKLYLSINAKYKTLEEKESFKEKCRNTKLKRYGNPIYNNMKKSEKTKLERYGKSNYVNVEKIKKTKLEKYNNENYNNSSKSSQTNLDKYGVSNCMKRKEVVIKGKFTKQERYGDSKYNNREKYRKTCLEKYGTENPRQNAAINIRIIQTCQEKYNANSPFGNSTIQDKVKSTLLSKYGYENPGAIPDIRNKIKQTCIEKYQAYPAIKNELLKEKSKKTFQEKFQVDYYPQTQEYKDLYKNKDFVKKKLEKEYQTKKQNHTFNSSSAELKIYNLLKEKFPDIVTQYRSEKYPFNCDFYIPSLDVYIEYQGSWTHGNHPYDENNPEDLKTLEKWKEKSSISAFYRNAIETWTIRDIKKREIAKANKLNYLEFFNEKESLDWFNSKI